MYGHEQQKHSNNVNTPMALSNYASFSNYIYKLVSWKRCLVMIVEISKILNAKFIFNN